MKQAERYLSEGLHPRVIVEGLEAAKKGTLEFLEKFKTPVKDGDREVLSCVARTSLRTKVRSGRLLWRASSLNLLVNSGERETGRGLCESVDACRAGIGGSREMERHKMGMEGRLGPAAFPPCCPPTPLPSLPYCCCRCTSRWPNN